MLDGSKFIPREIQERYELRGQVGRPVHWETYVVDDRFSGDTCILRFDREIRLTPATRQRLIDSYLQARRVKHPTLPRIRQMGIPPRGGFYVVHDFIHGVSLRGIGKELDWATVVNAVARVLPGLHLLHLNGVVHQRLTADRIVVEGPGVDRHASVLDTGPSVTEDGRRWAPWSVQAPEVARGEEFDGRADFYSLAVMVHDAMVGAPPFTEAAAERAARLGEYRDVPPLRAYREDCPPILEEILMRMGSHDPRDRPRTAMHLIQDLRRTGLLRGRIPSLSSREIIDATRWRLVQKRVEEVLAALPSDARITSVECDPGLETLADEVDARLGVEWGGRLGDEGKGVAKGKSSVVVFINSEPMQGNEPIEPEKRKQHSRRQNETTTGDLHSIDISPCPRPEEWKAWAARAVHNPIESRKLTYLLRTLSPSEWRSEEALTEYISENSSASKGALKIAWDSVEADAQCLAEAWLAELADRERAEARYHLAEELTRNSFGTVAVRVLTTAVRGNNEEALPSTMKTEALLLLAKASESQGDFESSVRWLQLAESLLGEGNEYPRACLRVKRAELTARIATNTKSATTSSMPDQLQTEGRGLGTNEPNPVRAKELKLRQAWDCVAKRAFRQAHRIVGQLTKGHEVPRETTPQPATLQRHPKLHGMDCLGHQEELLSLRILYERGLLEELARSAEQCVRSWRGSISGKTLATVMLLQAGAKIRTGDYRAGRRCAIISAREARDVGDNYSCAIAMRAVASAYFSENRYWHALKWSDYSDACIGKDATEMGRARAARARATYLFGVDEHYEATRIGLRSAHRWRRSTDERLCRDLFHTIGLGFLNLGRFRSAAKWLRRAKFRAKIAGNKKTWLKCCADLAEAECCAGRPEQCLEATKELVECSEPDELRTQADLLTRLLWYVHTRCAMEKLRPRKEWLALLKPTGAMPPTESYRADRSSLGGKGGARRRPHVQAVEGEELVRTVLWHRKPKEDDLERRATSVVRGLVRSGELVTAIRLCTVAASRSLTLGRLDQAAILLNMRRRYRGRIRLSGDVKCSRMSKQLLLENLAMCVEDKQRDLTECTRRFEDLQEEEALGRLGDASATASGLACSQELDEIIGEFENVSSGIGSAVILIDSSSGSICAARCQNDVSWSWRRMDEDERVRWGSCGWNPVVWRGSDGSEMLAVRSSKGRVMAALSWAGLLGAEGEVTDTKIGLARVIVNSIERHLQWESQPQALFHQPVVRGKINTFIPDARSVMTEAGPLLVASSAMNFTIRMVERLASKGMSILLFGESGTGKELLAGVAHRQNEKRVGPFVPVDCPSLNSGVVESELFGHVKGAYSGAHNNRDGLICSADGGTLFLDEIGDLSLGTQAKLLRILSAGELRPIGGNTARRIDFRLVSATNVDLSVAVRAGRFRLDLFHRLGAVVNVPPLRERKEDIQLLWDHFLEQCATDGLDVTYGEDVLCVLEEYEWPGNVRELANVAQAAVILSRGPSIDAGVLRHLLSSRGGISTVGLWSISEGTGNPRLSEGLKHVREKGRATRRSYAEALGISARSALRDLAELVEDGYLIRVGSGRATRYVPKDVAQ